MALKRPMHDPQVVPFIRDDHATVPARVDARGAIYTRREVVAFILDLAGYTSDRPLAHLRLLEPSVGHGDFLLPIVDRLLASWRANSDGGHDVAALRPAVCGVEIHAESFALVHRTLVAHLVTHNLTPDDATMLADAWLIHGDFLLEEFDSCFDFVIGNPPYVRQELIPDALIAEYRLRFHTIYDRADLYIPFIERSLTLLVEGGHLGFICADRWMKNRYGGPLRQMVAEQYHLKTYVDMVNTPAFQTEVIAYPAITIIARERGTITRTAHRPMIETTTLAPLARQLTEPYQADSAQVRSLTGVVEGAEPWILGMSDHLALVRRLEAAFPPLEDVGCRVGIGVATGADDAFIGLFDALDVEPDRKLPLAMTRDIQTGTVVWRGLGVINPFEDDGSVVSLSRYPRLRAYLEARRAVIAGRHIAQKSPVRWYRTIDRITPSLATQPKLLIPDIKGMAQIVYEPGRLYPHHNLYYIVSDTWNLRALQAVLRAGIAQLFVSTYAPRMRGGFLRFQAQYLRRIRIPHWNDVPTVLQTALVTAGERGDLPACISAVAQLYGLSEDEDVAIRTEQRDEP
ncbi:MAG: Eco57I restriction-modification methylase domain-containing protein [Chloroflexales bacterium]